MPTPPSTTPPSAPRSALVDFVETIEMSGGAVEHQDGTFAPQADPTWTDLGDSYLRACRELGREPKVSLSGYANADTAGDHLYRA
jgi:hypothetical protein